MEKNKEKPSNSNTAVNLKEVKVELVDIALYLSGFPEGTINLKDYCKRLDGSHLIDSVSNNVRKKPGRKTTVVEKSRQLGSPVRSRRSSLDEPSETVLSPKKVDGRKRSREGDSESDVALKISRRGSEMEETVKISPAPKVIKKTAKPKSKKISPAQSKKNQISLEVSGVATEEIPVENASSPCTLEETGSSAKSKQQPSHSKSDTSKLTDDTGDKERPESSMAVPVSSKVNKKADKIRKPSKLLSKEEVKPISVDCVSSTEGGDECSKENDGGKSGATDGERKSKRKRKSHVVFFSEDEDDPLPSIVRGKKVNDDKDFFGRAGRRGRLRPEPLQNDDDSDLDESTVSGNEHIDDQPDYLKNLDILMESTPKSTYTPFICSVCHEGYVSTVKGKLHKLVTHDPHSNLVLRLKRCDNEFKRLLAERIDIPKNLDRVSPESTNDSVDTSSPNLNGEIDCENRTSVLPGKECDSVNRTKSFSEDNSNGPFFTVKEVEKLSTVGMEDEPDDLFCNTNSLKPVSSEKAFDDLFGSSSEKDSVEETNRSLEICISSERFGGTDDGREEMLFNKKEADKDVEEAEQKREEDNIASTSADATSSEDNKEGNLGDVCGDFLKPVGNKEDKGEESKKEGGKHTENKEEGELADSNEEEGTHVENKEEEGELADSNEEEGTHVENKEEEGELADSKEGEGTHEESEDEGKLVEGEEGKHVENEEIIQLVDFEQEGALVEDEKENELVENGEEGKLVENEEKSELTVVKEKTDTDEVNQEEIDSNTKELVSSDEKTEDQFKTDERNDKEGQTAVDVVGTNVVNDPESERSSKGAATNLLIEEDKETVLIENRCASPKVQDSSCAADDQL
ncbi:hypothetical protein ONE63_005221 [Megalurothrips usitatus]|uniref:C2H2-type domain-containing protein n=1 Tax=Megalurothrips usitatus TaxID=439358 RepID=A0AAV7XYM8_9NEOP|nr:hypothetical protein ONE63_005221 [Megalurothrips usitatus]